MLTKNRDGYYLLSGTIHNINFEFMEAHILPDLHVWRPYYLSITNFSLVPAWYPILTIVLMIYICVVFFWPCLRYKDVSAATIVNKSPVTVSHRTGFQIDVYLLRSIGNLWFCLQKSTYLINVFRSSVVEGLKLITWQSTKSKVWCSVKVSHT